MCIKTVFLFFRSVLFPFAIKVCDLLCVNLLLLCMMARYGAFLYLFLFKWPKDFSFLLG